MDIVLSMNHLHVYLTGSQTVHDPSDEPVAHANSLMNDTAVAAFLKFTCTPEEMPSIEKVTATPGTYAKAVFDALQQRHVKTGPLGQILIIQEAFAIRYNSTVSFEITTGQLRKKNKEIWAQGAPDIDLFLALLMLNALPADDPSFKSIRSQVLSDLMNDTISSASVAKRLDAEWKLNQHLQNQPTSEPPAAFLSRTATTKAAVSERCGNSGCGKTGHSAKYCILPGGGMAGKSIPEAREAQRVDKGRSRNGGKGGKGSTGPEIRHTSGGEAYVFDADKGKVTFLSDSHTESANLVTLTTDHVNSLVSSSMSPANLDEYHHAYLSDSFASVDWSTNVRDTSQMPSSLLNASPIETTSDALVSSLDENPYLLDSGASTHISNTRSSTLR